MPKTGIFIVAYNCPTLLVPQLELIRKFCKDDFEIVILDNSTDLEASKGIKWHSKDCRYIKTNASSKMGSGSHSFAANLGYGRFGNNYDYNFWLDHDALPIKPFSVVEMLEGKLMAGLGQEKDKTYFWPGCFMFNSNKVKDVDFSPLPGLDTGGGTYKLIEKHGLESCVFFSEAYFENPYFVCDNPKYNYYTVIAETFMHFIGGSGWESLERNEERINSLLNIVKELTA